MHLQIVVIGVCTFKRPKMLAACLDSLAAQLLPEGCSLQIVVVDNDENSNARAQVDEFGRRCPFPVHYVHQPRRGIPLARNAIVDKAVALGAEWIAMLDDDETAAPDWIATLMAPEYRHVPVLQGLRVFVYPEPRPFWAREKPKRPEKEGSSLGRVSTNNVRFAATISQAGVRFDDSVGLSGGSDHRFFKAARAKGFEARRTNKAVTYETAHPERLSYRFMIFSHYRYVITLTRTRVEDDRSRWPVLLTLPGRFAECFVGFAELAISPFAYAFGRYRFKQLALRGGKRFAAAAGTVAGLLGVRMEAYRHVVGG